MKCMKGGVERKNIRPFHPLHHLIYWRPRHVGTSTVPPLDSGKRADLPTFHQRPFMSQNAFHSIVDMSSTDTSEKKRSRPASNS